MSYINLHGTTSYHTVYTPLGAVTESFVTNVGEPYGYGGGMTVQPQQFIYMSVSQADGGLTLANGQVFVSNAIAWYPEFGFQNQRENHEIYRRTGKSRSRYLRFQDPELEEISEAILQAYLTGAFRADLGGKKVTEAEHRANKAEMAFIHDIIKQQEENEKLIKDFRAKGEWRSGATDILRSKWS